MTGPQPTVPAEIAALLLLLSRVDLDDAARARAHELAAAVSDWPRLIALARDKFSLPFVARHLATLFPGGIEGVDFEAVKDELRPLALRSLQVAAAQVVFHRQVIVPLGVPHVYLKGPALAATYYGDPGLRFARDIDLLVPRDAFASVVRRAVEAGYRLVASIGAGRFASDARDVRAILRYQQVAHVVSPDNVMIEIHREVDKNQGLFDEDELIARGIDCPLQGVAVRALPTDLLFLFVCYHSTRHTWSLLHWVADLDAIRRHPGFDRGAVLELARQKGMAPLVEACLDFGDLTTRLPLRPGEGTERGRAILALCLKNLEGGLEVELALRDRQVALDLPFDWLLTPEVARQVRARRLRGRFMPSYQQYELMPLPDALQWLYLPAKPLFWLRWHFAGRKR